MRSGCKTLPKQSGFTILEIIVSLIVASILGVIYLEFMGTTVQKSYEPINMTQNSLDVNQIIEKMNADYRKHLLLSPDPLAAFKTDVENGNTPSPPPYYGDYNVQTTWIKFSGGSEAVDASGENRVLKVKITFGNRSVTALFTK
jgi:prepilin-type N-terminal cleavage/methylation domain-containing protein